jgi:hypothetical protein
MRNKASIQLESSKIEADTSLLEISNSELLTTLNNIRSLQMTLYRLASILDGDASEVLTVTQSALKKISDEIIQVFAFRYMQNNQEALQNWENEEGKIVYASL